ncbi:MAG TPA: HAD hydrolase-like protein [Crinalium sp.]|jgi:phosphoglycolate phosphatase-like HAD superfamily hydrolase
MPGVAVSTLSQFHTPHPISHLRPHSKLTIFCDFDGPIIDVSERYYQTYQLALADVKAAYQEQGIQLPICLLSKEQFWQMKQERVPDLEIALRSGLRQEQMDLFMQRVLQIVNQPALLSQDRLQPGVRWSLALLRAQGANLVLVTLRCQQQAAQLLQSYGLLHLFSAIRGLQDTESAYTNSSDQKTQLLARVLQEAAWHNLHHETAWMIGDTEADVLAGQAAGLRTIALTCGIRSKSYLQQFQPTRVHSDLLSATHHLVSQPVVLG